MTSIPPSMFRVSTAMSGDLLLSNLRRTHVELLRTQNQLATGLRINRPSDEPRSIGPIHTLRSLLDRFDQQLRNLDRAGALADVTDQALRDAGDLLLEARTIASSQIGVGSDAETRRSQAEVIDGLLDAMLRLANREHLGVHLFAGRRSSEAPFVSELGGVRYIGAPDDLTDQLGGGEALSINTNGAAALSALSARVAGTVDLDPNATPATRLADLNGARGRGVTLGAITVTVNGTPAEVDLRGADTLGDVADRINDAIGAAGSLSITADGFTLTAGAGQTIDIADIGAGVTAADLGIDISASGGSTAGADLAPRLTDLTDLAQLGVAVDLSSGLKITNGGVTKVVDFSAAQTVQDLANAVSAADLGVRLEINDRGDGLNLVNEVSGAALSIGENAGGSTATDLGLRSFAAATALSGFNDGLGVRITEGAADFRIELGDGATTIDVDLAGAATVADVIAAINAAGGGAVTASLAADGNGLVLTDNIGGGADFRVTPLNNSFAAQDLGIAKNAGSSATLSGEDTATIRTDSVFTHLIMLRDALRNNDERGITLAGQKVERDIERLATVRAQVGVRANRVEAERQRTEDRRLQTRAILSDLRDTDFAEAVTRLQQLQQQLTANLQTGRQTLRLSLLDFLG